MQDSVQTQISQGLLIKMDLEESILSAMQNKI